MAKTIKKELFNPLVSIVIPVYNGSNYVREAIDSALAQTYKNIEIIIVNDGSTDNTEELIKSYKDKRIRYFKKENGGVSTALNLGIKKMRGEYFSWLSHDDLYYPNKIEKQISILIEDCEEKKEKTILYSNYSLINENSEKISDLKFEKNNFIEKLNYPFYPLLNGLINGCTLLIPKKCFNEVGYFDPKLRATQDYDLWFKMFPKYELFFIKDNLVKTRIHSEQSTKKITTVNQECNNLWINMVKRLNDDQKRKISGSILSFYKNTYEIVKNAGYDGAKSFLLKIIKKYKNRDISKIKVSVIIPFFNRVNWTIEAIKSVLDQTHQNLEIILIDDASTEDIKKIKDLIKNEKRIIYYRNSNNSGVSYSRNCGINKASGEFISFLDSDDLFEKKKIEIQLYFMVSNGYVFSHTSYETFIKSNESINKIDSGNTDYIYPSIIAGCSIATPTVMVDKELFNEKNIKFPENIDIGEDICMWIQISKNCKLYGLNIPLSKVRKHGNNASDSEIKQVIGIKNQFDFVFKNSLDERSYIELKKLNELLFWHINNIFVKKSDSIYNENFQNNIKSKIKDLVLISFYKIDKIVPKKIRGRIKLKLIKYSFVRKYLIK